MYTYMLYSHVDTIYIYIYIYNVHIHGFISRTSLMSCHEVRIDKRTPVDFSVQGGVLHSYSHFALLHSSQVYLQGKHNASVAAFVCCFRPLHLHCCASPPADLLHFPSLLFVSICCSALLEAANALEDTCPLYAFMHACI